MKRLAALPALLLATAALAENGHYPAPGQPHGGLETRAVKALSPGETEALLTGQGFSQALTAELNGYPGPRHLLDLAGALGLTGKQQAQVAALFDAMRQEAAALGRSVVRAERRLDRAFAEGGIDEGSPVEQSEAIGRLRGLLRASHLKYHLRTKALLTPHQTMLYARLRGYADGGHESGRRHP